MWRRKEADAIRRALASWLQGDEAGSDLSIGPSQVQPVTVARKDK